MANNSTNINKTNNYLSSQMEHKKRLGYPGPGSGQTQNVTLNKIPTWFDVNLKAFWFLNAKQQSQKQ